MLRNLCLFLDWKCPQECGHLPMIHFSLFQNQLWVLWNLLAASESQFTRLSVSDTFHPPPPNMFHFPEVASVSCGSFSSVLRDMSLFGMTEVQFHFHLCDAAWYMACWPLLSLEQVWIHSSSELPEKQLGPLFFFFYCPHSLYRIWTDQINRIGACPLPVIKQSALSRFSKPCSRFN